MSDDLRDGKDEKRRGREPASLPRRPSREEIDEEIAHHLRGRIEELMEAGHDRESAERQARRRFGDADRVRRRTERVYRRPRRPTLGMLAGAMAGALRSLRRRPVFTATAVLLLAIGSATSTSMLAVVDAYLLREMPYPQAERLAWVSPVAPQTDSGTHWPPPVQWTDLEEVELAVTWDLDVFTLLGDGRPEEVRGAWVPPDFFSAFGVAPALGRGFTADEIGPDAAPVALISHDLWQSRFGADPDVLGRTIRMYASDRPEQANALTVVGVLPAEWWHVFAYTQVLVPLSDRNQTYVVRVAPDVPLEEAAARMTTLARSTWGPGYEGWSIELLQMHERHVQEIRPLLGALGAGVALVLLIACANVAVLLLVQATARTRELALRAALGAGRGRLALGLLAEAGLLAAAGAAVGVLVAGMALTSLAPVIEQQLGTRVPGGAVGLALTPRVVLASVGVTLVLTLLFGLAPLVMGVGRDMCLDLTAGGRSVTGAARQRHLRTGLIVVELALSLALLAGAGLTLRSALHLSRVDLGFDARGLLRVGMGLSAFRYPGPEEWNARIDETLARFRAVPGVEDAVAAIPSPLSFTTDPVEPLDGPLADAEEAPRAAARYVTPGYFRTLRIELLDGRDFDRFDARGSEPVAIVSDRLAARLWPGEQPLGKSVRIRHRIREGESPWRRVIGVVEDTRESLVDDGELPDAYVPLSQGSFRYANLLVRSQRPPESLLPVLERIVWNDDPEQPLSRPVSMQQVVRDATSTPVALARMLTVFAFFGALLAVVGVYGVIAFAARQRRREIAVRIALGATSRDVRGLVLRHGVRVVAAGLTIGLAAAWLMARALANQIHGVSATDPATFALVTALLGCAALSGAVLPARRAATTNPVELLREE